MIKRISRASIYRTRWERRALYNNTNNTHTLDVGIGTVVRKTSLEIVIVLVVNRE